MKVLVVGGAGYIGSHVSRELLDRGHEVTVYDNLSFGQRVNLFPEAGFVEADILDPGALSRCLAGGYRAIVHLAAFKAAGESMTSPEKYAANNIGGTIQVLNAASAAGVKHVVFSSSAAVYGEPQYLPIDEDHPLNPENFYGFTKLEIERILGWYDKLRGLRFAALRYFNAAGYDPAGRVLGRERNPANLLPIIMEVAAGTRPSLRIFGDDYPTPDGTGVRDYIHVTDLAVAHVEALEHILREDRSLTVNLGSETGLSVKEILEAARRITGQEIPSVTAGRRPGDPAKLVSSAERARKLLGWERRHSDLESLIATAWNVYRREAAP